jgi:hypothetical protein
MNTDISSEHPLYAGRKVTFYGFFMGMKPLLQPVSFFHIYLRKCHSFLVGYQEGF